MSLRITLPVALFLSLCLHAAVLTSALRSAQAPAKSNPPPMLDVELTPPAEDTAASLSTEPVPPAPEATLAAPAIPATPIMARGLQLQRAQTALSRHLLYPPAAVEQGLEGEVILLLMLDERGRITSAGIASSSGHPILDQAALAAARQIAALPGNPRQTLLPVRFRLD